MYSHDLFLRRLALGRLAVGLVMGGGLSLAACEVSPDTDAGSFVDPNLGTGVNTATPDASGPGVAVGAAMTGAGTPPATGGAASLDAGTSSAGKIDGGSASDSGVAPVDAGAAVDAGSAGDPKLVGIAGSNLTVYPTNGMPVDVKDGAWTYLEFPDTSCRNPQNKAGVTLWRNHQSKKVMFFYEGGGACFDDLTCAANADAVGDGSKSPSGGILDRTRAENPTKDWNVVYVPYCTGDVFGGTNADAMIGGQAQKFVGYLNNQAFLQRLVPTFSDATDVLVTGVSAGGFGAAMSAMLIQRAFPWVKVKVIDDSGPPMPSTALPSCLQKKWRELWGFDKSILVDCGAGCPNKDDYTMALGLQLAKNFQNRLSGLIEAQEDGVISGFFGAGSNDCTGVPFLDAVPGDQFHAGLLAFRDAAKAFPNFGSYLPPGSDHTWLQGDSFYNAAVDGASLLTWVSDILADKGVKNVGN